MIFNGDATIAALKHIADEIPHAAIRAALQAGRVGMISLLRTQRFTNRTFQLNKAFRETFTADGSRVMLKLDVDPNVQGTPRIRPPGILSRKPRIAPRGYDLKPPNTYARFLQNGTRLMEARPFMTDASDAVSGMLGDAVELQMGNLIRGDE